MLSQKIAYFIYSFILYLVYEKKHCLYPWLCRQQKKF